MGGQKVMGPARPSLDNHSFVISTSYRYPRFFTLIIILSFITLVQATTVPKIDIKLEGSGNYRLWANQVKSALIIMGLWALVITTSRPLATPIYGPDPKNPERTIITKKDDSEGEKWDKDNDTACAVVRMTLGLEAQQEVEDDTLAADEVWEKLKETYGKPSPMEGFISFGAMFRVALDISQPLRPQLDRLSLERSRLAALSLYIPPNHFALIMLLALPPSWTYVVGTILAATTLDSLDPAHVRARILDEEARSGSASHSLSLTTTSPGTAATSSTTVSTATVPPRRQRPYCEHCKVMGHTKDTCWALHGKPDDWVPRRGRGKDREGVITGAAAITTTTALSSVSSATESVRNDMY